MGERGNQSMITRRCLLAVASMAIANPVAAFSQTVIPRNLGKSSATIVNYASKERSGTVIVDAKSRLLYLILSPTQALRYSISVGRDGFRWSGTVKVGAKKEWPFWTPPAEMRQRDPSLPDQVPPGPLNPLGARAIYLYRGGADTLFRIHGTNDADAIGGNQTSGCFRLTNKDVMDIYQRIEIGAKVIVLD